MADTPSSQARHTFSGARFVPVRAVASIVYFSIQSYVLYLFVVDVVGWLLGWIVHGEGAILHYALVAMWGYNQVLEVGRFWRLRRDTIFAKDVLARYVAIADQDRPFRLATSLTKDGSGIVVETTAPRLGPGGVLVLDGTYRNETKAGRAKRHPCESVTVDEHGRIEVVLSLRGETYTLAGASLFDPESLRVVAVATEEATSESEEEVPFADVYDRKEKVRRDGSSGPSAASRVAGEVKSKFKLRPRPEGALNTMRAKPASTPSEREAEAIIAERVDNSDAELTRARRRVAMKFHPDRVPNERRKAMESVMSWANTRIDDIENGLSN